MKKGAKKTASWNNGVYKRIAFKQSSSNRHHAFCLHLFFDSPFLLSTFFFTSFCFHRKNTFLAFSLYLCGCCSSYTLNKIAGVCHWDKILSLTLKCALFNKMWHIFFILCFFRMSDKIRSVNNRRNAFLFVRSRVKTIFDIKKKAKTTVKRILWNKSYLVRHRTNNGE